MAATYALGRYAALCDWLAAVPAEQASAELSFAKIEAIIGGHLPPSAWSTAFWTGSATAIRYWRRTGFRARLDRRELRVLFARQGG